jgi:malate/lactate dehydrogenase
VQRESVLARVKSWFGDMLMLGVTRTMGWTSGLGLARMVAAIANESNDLLACSVIADGEYGISGISIGLPVRLGKNGVREIIELPLTDAEYEGLRAAENKIRSLTHTG